MKPYPLFLTHPTPHPAGFSPSFRSTRGELRSDFETTDGHYLIETKYRLPSARDLFATILRLARATRDSGGREGCLVLVHPMITLERLRTEWSQTMQLLHPDLAQKLHLVVLPEDEAPHGDLVQTLHPLLDWILQNLERGGSQSQDLIPRESFFRVLTTLVILWLRRGEPITTLDLQRMTGLSYPPVVRALDRLEARNELERKSDRRVTLSRFPEMSWQELATLSHGLRSTTQFAPPAGEKAELENLLERVRKRLPSKAALGGVEAARRWYPEFDLNGLPRIDITVQAPEGRAADLGFLKKVDPSLRPTTEGSPARVAVAVHVLRRREPFFETDPKDGLRFTDPVETLLDLQELRLSDQADALLRHLAPRRTS
jgi:hypothetical protein